MSSAFVSVTILTLVAIQLILIRSVSSLNITNSYLNHDCNNTQARYEPGSVFEKNLNRCIHNISRSNLSEGYMYEPSEMFGYKVTEDPNIVFVLLQCRGDSYGSHCQSCFKTALADLQKRCPGNRGATIWYDQCLLAISNSDSEGRIHYQNIICMSNPKNLTTDPKVFKQKKKALISQLIKKSVKRRNGNKASLYAAGDVMVGKQKLYAMVQCTNDIHENGCEVCHEYFDIKYQDCAEGKLGGRVVSRSCNYRYEFYPFLRP